MVSVDKITETFCIIDDFCIEFDQAKSGHVLSEQTDEKRRTRSYTLSDSEVITILILFHTEPFRNLKHFYLHYVNQHSRKEFPRLVCYNRFVELQQKATMPMAIFLKTFRLGQCTGISFVDSTQVFKGLVPKGQCSIGWFFGFKLHLIINYRGEILDFMLTKGNVDDHEPLKQKSFHDKIFGKLFGDKGYICKTLFKQLFIDGIHLIIKLRKNMKKLSDVHSRQNPAKEKSSN